jgi:hypothetical protein
MTRRHWSLLGAALAALAAAACSSDETTEPGGTGGGTTVTTSSGGSATGGSSTGGSATGGSATGGSATGGSATGGSATGGSSQGGSGAGDPYEAARQACIDKINQLRATKNRPPYTRWTSAEACADQQATQDEQNGDPHGAFGQCGENAQNECLGGGPGGIESCLDMMWAEKDQPGCAGCDACADAYDPNCPNCDFYGSQTGDVCGHYVNLSANYFSRAACGFSSVGSWAVIDFD